ncbi:flagellar export chaperone FliS [Paenibacillus rigui]|uniref:Flagellar secretion chaperone FliS n=1 Tax=Paenibacillus rigui TaxID=554312 RepID=A0A229USF0_9BACL|nr:flagellar export chaperone FliS [Paenibacillus rigui]OXM86358.1 flagellar export chaperone FliS [Paenibacillus rigui]
MNYRAQQSYLTSQVNTAHPGDLTLMLYNGCIKFMKQAIDSIEKKDYEAKNNYIQRAIDIIDELMITLNMSYPISQNLFSLYQFMKENLIQGNIKLDIQKINVSMNLITELKEAWAQALKQVKSESPNTVTL